MFRNQEKDKETHIGGLGGVEDEQGVRVKMEAQINSTSSLFRNSRAVNTKLVAQVAYGVGFGRSTYARKSNEKTFSMVFFNRGKPHFHYH